MNVNVGGFDEGGGGAVESDVGGGGGYCGFVREARRAAWEGSRREVSMEAREGGLTSSGCIIGGGGAGLDELDASASHAAFSSSSLDNVSFVPQYRQGAYRLTSSSSSARVALFFSFWGFGLLTTGGGATSSCEIG